MNAASFMAMPFFTVYLSRTLNYSAVQVGTIMTTWLVASRVTQLLTGPLSDRLGYRPMMVFGVAVRALGFLAVGVYEDFWLLLLSSFVIGLGGAIYDPAVNGVFASQPETIRPRVFAIHNLFLNIGAVGGPAIGGLLVVFGAKAAFLTSSVIFGAVGIFLFFAREIPKPSLRGSIVGNYRKALGHTRFRSFLLIMTIWWSVFSQLTISFPVMATEWGGGDRWTSLVFLVNGSVGIALALVVNRLYSRHAVSAVLHWGFLILTLGFLLVPIRQSLWWLMVCVGIFTIAETIILIGSDLMVASYTDHETGATFFGIYMISWAIGGAAGNYLGSWLILSHSKTALPWIVYAAIALSGTLAVYQYRKRFRAPDRPGFPVETA